MKRASIICLFIAAICMPVFAQDSGQAMDPMSQKAEYGYGGRAELFVTGFGFWTSEANDNAIRSRATQAGGGAVGYRFQLNSSSAVEGRYGFSRNSQKYTIADAVSSIPTYQSEISGSYVYSFIKAHRLQPFIEGGGGLFLFSPANYGSAADPSATDVPPVYGGSSAGLGTQAKPMFLAGAGANISISGHWYVRTEFRALGNKPPDFGIASFQTSAFAFVYQPSVGIAFRF